jgi:hypothetical protein
VLPAPNASASAFTFLPAPIAFSVYQFAPGATLILVLSDVSVLCRSMHCSARNGSIMKLSISGLRDAYRLAPLARLASDHLPVAAELSIDPAAEALAAAWPVRQTG